MVQQLAGKILASRTFSSGVMHYIMYNITCVTSDFVLLYPIDAYIAKAGLYIGAH